MSRPVRRAPTPAAVLSYVALGTLALTCALLTWNDALDQSAAGEYAWPLDPALITRDSVDWAVTVTLTCAVVWVATLRQSRLGHPWRVAVSVATGVAAWCGVAWISLTVAYQLGGWYVPWPGPVAPTAHVNDPAESLDTVLALRPGVLIPLALVVTVAATAWSAARHGRAATRPFPAPVRLARTVAFVVLGPPAVAAATAATLLQTSTGPWDTPLERVVAAVVSPGAGIALAVATALALAGAGRAGAVMISLVLLAVVGPLVARWWAGEADNLLATVALGTLAVALAAGVHPVAMALSRLEDPDRGDQSPVVETAPSVRAVLTR